MEPKGQLLYDCYLYYWHVFRKQYLVPSSSKHNVLYLLSFSDYTAIFFKYFVRIKLDIPNSKYPQLSWYLSYILSCKHYNVKMLNNLWQDNLISIE